MHIHSVVHLLTAYCVPDMIQGTRDTSITKQTKLPALMCISCLTFESLSEGEEKGKTMSNQMKQITRKRKQKQLSKPLWVKQERLSGRNVQRKSPLGDVIREVCTIKL